MIIFVQPSGMLLLTAFLSNRYHHFDLRVTQFEAIVVYYKVISLGRWLYLETMLFC